MCREALLPEPILVLSGMPGIAQHFPGAADLAADRPREIDARQCGACGLVQLASEPVPYYRDVIRAVAYSQDMEPFRVAQFRAFAEDHGLVGRRVLEVGCGRGEFLRLIAGAGMDAVGLEHDAAAVATASAQGLQAVQGFLDAPDTRVEGGPYAGFLCLAFLEHVPDPNAFLRGIAHNLEDGGVGLVEVPSFDMIVREQYGTEFMADHLSYFTAETLRTTLGLNGFEVLECGEVWHGYMLSAVVRRRRRASFAGFEAQRAHVRGQLDAFLARHGERGVAVWGAGHQALAAIALHELGGRLACVVDRAPFKQNRFTPGTHVPVLAPAVLSEDPRIQAVIVIGGSYADEIVAGLRRDFRPDLAVAVLRPDGLHEVARA